MKLYFGNVLLLLLVHHAILGNISRGWPIGLLVVLTTINLYFDDLPRGAKK